MDKKNILITGVAGLLGSNMADWILKNHQEFNVIGVDDLSGGYIDNVNDKVIFENYNLTDKNLSNLFDNEVSLTDWDIKAVGKVDVINANKNIFNSVNTINVDVIETFKKGNKFRKRN